MLPRSSSSDSLDEDDNNKKAIFSLSVDSTCSVLSSMRHDPQPVEMPRISEKALPPIKTASFSTLPAKYSESKTQGRDGLVLQVRYPVVILSVLALSSLMANVVCFNFVVLCMPSTNEPDNANHTYIGYPKQEKTIIFSAVAIGALLAVVPVSHLTHSWGTRNVFFTAGMLSTIATAFIPIASRQSLYLFVALRFIQGMAMAATMPTVGSVTSAWASLGQHGLFMSTLTTFGQISAIFSMPVAGILCMSSFGWSSVFYLHAVISFIIFCAWFAVYRNQPAKHPLISQAELKTIHKGKSVADLQKYGADGKRKGVPYKLILTTPAVWAVWLGALGDLVAVQLVHIFSPQYIREVLGYSVEKTGWTAALPVLFQFFIKMLAGHSSDRIVGVSETVKLRIYNSLALGGAALFMIGLAFVPKGYPTWGIVLMTMSNAMFGFNGGGFNKCATLVSRQFSHFVMANIQVILCLSMLISPILVNSMLSSPAKITEWRTIFLSHAGLLLVTNAIFCLLATAHPALWTEPDGPTKANQRNQSVLSLREQAKEVERREKEAGKV